MSIIPSSRKMHVPVDAGLLGEEGVLGVGGADQQHQHGAAERGRDPVDALGGDQHVGDGEHGDSDQPMAVRGHGEPRRRERVLSQVRRCARSRADSVQQRVQGDRTAHRLRSRATATSGLRVRAISAATSSTVASRVDHRQLARLARQALGDGAVARGRAGTRPPPPRRPPGPGRDRPGSSRGIAIRSTWVPGRMVTGRPSSSTTIRPGRFRAAISRAASSAGVDIATVG